MSEIICIDTCPQAGYSPSMAKSTKWMVLAALGMAILACRLPWSAPANPTTTLPPLPTVTPSLTPTPTWTPTPAATPTPLPAGRLAAGDQARFWGDWDAALREYQAALEGSSDPEERAAALLGIGMTRSASGDYPGALQFLREVLADYPASTQAAAAALELGSIYTQLGRFPEAAEAFQQYLDLRPGTIDAYVLEWQGDAYFTSGDYQAAIAAYQSSLAAPHLESDSPVQVKLANSYAAAGEVDKALALYEDIYQTTQNDYTRAQVNLLMGQIYAARGETDRSQARFQDSVTQFPLAYDTYQGLVSLVEAGVEVNELDRGMVDYYAGQYSVAIAAFNRYLDTTDPHTGQAHYYKALALEHIDEDQAAVDELEHLIETHPSSDPYWADAWEEVGYTQWARLDQYTEAVETFLSFVARVPDHPRAPEFLFDAAQVSERAGRLEQAAQIWSRVADEYPTAQQANRARFLAGISWYRLGELQAALNAFQMAAESARNPGDRAAASLWIGKALAALGDESGARATWNRTAAIDPTGYYSERARELAAGKPPFADPGTIDLSIDRAGEQAEAERWLAATFNLPEGSDLTGPGPLAEDPRLIRGTELWRLGFTEPARTEFESLRLSIVNQPVENYRLAVYLADLGLYRTAIFCARQVLTLAGLDDAGTMNAPAFFNHLRFGTYFKELVLAAAEENHLNPLLLFSLIRQESLFEGFVRSTAGARGLMQIIPSTGQWVAETKGWPPGYSDEDLYRPAVNIEFGAWYLAEQRDFLDGDLYAALAAYNGGPGNANNWQGLAGGDPDLFLEIVRFDETRRYIRGVYEIYSIYRRLYAREQ